MLVVHLRLKRMGYASREKYFIKFEIR